MGPDSLAAPLDIERLCRRGRFDLEEVSLHGAEGKLQALLFPAARDRFSILVDTEPPGGWANVDPVMRPTLHDHRLRFRVCHEVAHTFFFDRSGPVPRPLAGPSARQERFCDGFASKILIPPKAIASLPASAASVVELHEQFRVSLEVATRAFAAVHRDALMALYVTRGDDPPVLQWTNRPRAHECFKDLLGLAGRSMRKSCSVARLETRRQALAVATP
jgi:hypothetical protein